MRNELQRHKKNDKIKWALTAVAFVLFAVLLAGMCLQVFGNGKAKPSNWFTKPDTEQTTLKSDENIITDGAIINESASNGVKLLSNQIARAAYTENGISEQAENAYTITADIYPSYSTEKTLVWSLAWRDSNSDFASGKNESDYISVTISSDTLSATVVCLQPFGEQLIISASITSIPSVKGVCTLDYKQRYVSTDLDIAFTDSSHNGSAYTTISSKSSDCIFPQNTNTSNGWHTANKYSVKNAPCYTVKLSEIYTVPYSVESISFNVYLKLNDTFFTALNEFDSTNFNSTNAAADWKQFNSCDFSWQSDSLIYIPSETYYVTDFFKCLSDKIVGNVYRPNIYCFGDYYSDFVSVARNIYDDVSHLFSIKIVTTLDGAIYETISNQHAVRSLLSVSASSVNLNESAIVF